MSFVQDFVQMRKLMTRMVNEDRGAGAGGGGENLDGGSALGGGNRAARRAAKKRNKTKPASKGFGK